MKQTLLLTFLLGTVALSAQTVTRKVSLAKGQQLEQQSLVEMNMTQEMNGQAMEVKMKSTITNLVEVKDDASNSFTVANTLKRVLMNMNMMGQEMNFDSDKKEDLDGQIGQSYKDKIGKSKEYTLNKDGYITAIKNAEQKTADDGGMMSSIMKSAAEEEKVGSSFNSLSNIPAKGVKVGESWIDSASDGKSRTVSTYTLKQLNGTEGVVDIAGDMSVSREMEQQGMTMQMDIKGTTIGQYTFDVNSGLVKSRQATTKASGTVEVMGQTVPITIETTLTTTLNKK